MARQVGRARPGLAVTGPVLAAALVALAIVNVPALWNGSYSAKAMGATRTSRSTDSRDRRGRPGPARAPILEVPGSDFAAYRSGETIDPITPGLTDRPYVVWSWCRGDRPRRPT